MDEKEQLPGLGVDWRPPSPTALTRRRALPRDDRFSSQSTQSMFAALTNDASASQPDLMPQRPVVTNGQHWQAHATYMPRKADSRAQENEENLLIDFENDSGTTTSAPFDRVETYVRDLSTSQQDLRDLYIGEPTEDGMGDGEDDFPVPPVEGDAEIWAHNLVESRSPSTMPELTRSASAEEPEQCASLDIPRTRSRVTTPVGGDHLENLPSFQVRASTSRNTEPLDLLTGPEPLESDKKVTKPKPATACKDPADFPDIPDGWGMSKKPEPEPKSGTKPRPKKPATVVIARNATLPDAAVHNATGHKAELQDEEFPPLGQARGRQIPKRSYASAAASVIQGAPTTNWSDVSTSHISRGNAAVPQTRAGPRREASIPRGLNTRNTRATTTGGGSLRGSQPSIENTRATTFRGNSRGSVVETTRATAIRGNSHGSQPTVQNTRGRGNGNSRSFPPRGGRGPIRGYHHSAPSTRPLALQFHPPRQSNFIPKGPRHNMVRVNPAQAFQGRDVEGPKPRITPDLVVDHDNIATSAWRKGEKQETHIYTLPLSFNMIAGTSNNVKDNQPAIPRLAEIAAIEGVHIQPTWPSKQERQTNNGIKVYIYGNADGINRAINLMNQWYDQIKELQKASKSLWAKVWAFDAAVEKRIQRRIERDEKRQTFRKLPEIVYPFKRPFGWPSDIDYSPHQCLGTNLEALDPIRMEFGVFINYATSASAPILLVQGETSYQIEQAICRLGGVGPQLDARSFEPDTAFLLNIPDFSDVEAFPRVNMHPYWNPALIAGEESPDDSKGMVPTLTKPMPRPQAETVDDGIDEPLAQRLMRHLSNTCQYLPSYRGSMKMRITLGTLVLQNYRAFKDENDPGYPFSEFHQMMGEFQVDGHVTRELGDKILEDQVLQRCFKSKGLLFPQTAGVSSLADIQPVYTASFVIGNPNGKSDLFMDATLSDYEGVSTVENRRWWRLDSNATDMTQLLDTNLVNVSHGTAWHFGLESGIPIEEAALSLDYRGFGHSLELDLDAAKNMNRSNFIIYEQDGVLQVPVKEVQQRRCWRFNTKAGEWVLEVARVDKTVLRPGEAPLHWEPRWTVNFWHNDWDQHLTHNARLEIGMQAKWAHGNPVNTLFPAFGEAGTFDENIGITNTAHAYEDLGEMEERERRQDYDRKKAIVEGEIDLYANKKSTEPGCVKGFEELLDTLGKIHEVIVGERK